MQPPSRHYHSFWAEHTLRNLDRHFAVQNESEVERWCREQDVDYSLPARLAFFVICQDKYRDAQKAAPDALPPSWVTLIPRPWDSEEAWRELVEWRHPRLDLNLLQLAIVLKSDLDFVDYFWHPAFLKEENYQDASGRLVNHPFHLMLALRHWNQRLWTKNVSLEDIRVEFLLEERTIDLSAARLQRRPSETTHQVFFTSQSNELFSWVSEPEYCLVPFLRLNDLKTELASWTFTGTVFPFRDDMISADACAVLSTILKKLSEPQARASTVELLWQVQSHLSRSGFSLEFLEELERDVYCCRGQFLEDVQLLLCQLYWAVKKKQRWMVIDPKAMKKPLMISQLVCWEQSYLKICKFIPNEYLNMLIFQYRYDFEGITEGYHYIKPLLEEAADGVENVLRERTLQDHCVLSILDAVNGDARKVWGLSELPEPLKQLFPVPFQELQEKLRTEEQSPVDAPEQENEL